MPPNHAAATITLNEDKTQILLQKREDFRIWTIPGGGLDPGETPAEAAVRETFEETGYHVAVDRLVGKYHRPQMNNIRHIYQARVIGGTPITRGPETRAVGWFPLDDLPRSLSKHIHEMIQDALANTTNPVNKTQRFAAWQVWLIRTLLALRNLRNRWRGLY